MPVAGSRRELVLSEHRDEITRVAAEHKAQSIALTGSVARGDDSEDSDYDFVATFAPGASLFDLVGLKDDLEQLLGCSVDVMSVGGLTDRHAGIQQDAITL